MYRCKRCNPIFETIFLSLQNIIKCSFHGRKRQKAKRWCLRLFLLPSWFFTIPWTDRKLCYYFRHLISFQAKRWEIQADIMYLRLSLDSAGMRKKVFFNTGTAKNDISLAPLVGWGDEIKAIIVVVFSWLGTNWRFWNQVVKSMFLLQQHTAVSDIQSICSNLPFPSLPFPIWSRDILWKEIKMASKDWKPHYITTLVMCVMHLCTHTHKHWIR